MTERTYNLKLVIVLWLAGLGAAAQYGKVSVIFSRLPEVYPEAGTRLGFAVSLVGFVGIFLGVTAGVLAARIGFRRAILAALTVGGVLSLIQASFPPLPAFLALRVVEGASHLAIVVAAPTLISQLTPSHLRGLMLTLWGTFFGVAFTILAWVGLPMVDRFGLAPLFAVHGLYLLVFAAILFPLLPRDSDHDRGGDLSLATILRKHAAIYASPFISASAIGWLFYTFCFVSLLTLLPTFVAPQLRVLVIGAIPLVTIASSMTLGVFLMRWLSEIGVVQTGFATGAGFALLLVYAPGNPVLILCLAGSLGLVQGASFAAVPVLNEPMQDRALANGALAQTGNIGNTLGTPVMVAVIGLGGYTAMMLTAMGAMACGVLAHGWLALRRHRVKSA